MDLTGIGIWSSQLRYGNPAESADAAAELDELGFRALWIPDVGGAVFDAVGNVIEQIDALEIHHVLVGQFVQRTQAAQRRQADRRQPLRDPPGHHG